MVISFRTIVIPIVILCGFAGCKPELQEVELVEENSASKESSAPEETSPELPTIQVSEIKARDARIIAETRHYSVITDPWSKYFRADPSLIILPKLTKGVEDFAP